MPLIHGTDDVQFGRGPFNRPPFDLKTCLPGLSKEAGAEHLVFDIRQLPPGAYSFPYHYHRNAEELMFVMSGTLTMRSPDGFTVVNRGDVVFCEKGEKGAHQFYNHTAEPCTYLDVKTFLDMDIVVYPDSGKIMVSRYSEVFRQDAQTDYFAGEEGVDDKWKEYLAGRDE
jgi:uncharacterized cupin superfamily protein